jgi:aminoglycoside 6'-N-acetyltransferase
VGRLRRRAGEGRPARRRRGRAPIRHRARGHRRGLHPEENEPEFRHAGIDLFLRTDLTGRGLGPDAIRTLAAHLIDEHGHHRLTIDPAADNSRAIAAYEKVGFRPVGRLRRYQRMPDGRWIDGLFMELLAEELVR